MLARALRGLFVLVTATVAGGTGLAMSLALTPPGHAVLARVLGARLSEVLGGTVRIGAVSGRVIGDVTLRDVVLRDRDSIAVVRVGRAHLRYRVTDLLAGDVVLTQVDLDDPVVLVERSPRGRISLAEVLDPQGGAPAPAVGRPAEPPGGAVALRRVELREVTVHGGDVLARLEERTVRIRGLDARLSLVRFGSPVVLEVDAARAEIDGPRLSVRDLGGRVEVDGDSLRFALTRVALPGTSGPASGAVAWGGPRVTVEVAADARRLDLTDLRGLRADLPPFRGHAAVAVALDGAGVLTTDLSRLVMARGGERVAGRAGLVTDSAGIVRVRDARLDLQRIELATLEPLLHTGSFRGALTGHVEVDGPPSRLAVAGNLDLLEHAATGPVASHLQGAGHLGVGGAPGLAFDSLRLAAFDVALSTVRRALPGLALAGRLSGDGVLNGTLRTPGFAGRVVHDDGAGNASTLGGTLRVDARGEVPVLAGDVTLAPLTFDGIRAQVPWLRATGTLSGQARFTGTPRAMLVDVDLAGTAGHLAGNGLLVFEGERRGVEGLDARVTDLNLAALDDRWPVTRLSGMAAGEATAGGDDPPSALLEVELGPGMAMDVPIDTVSLVLRAEQGVVAADTLLVRVPGAQAEGSGGIGWFSSVGDSLHIRLRADSLEALDPLVRRWRGDSAAPRAERRLLHGRGEATIALAGRRDSLDLMLDAVLGAAGYDALEAQRVTAHVRRTGGPRQVIEGAIELDTLRASERRLVLVRADAAGPGDNIAWRVHARATAGRELHARGAWQQAGGGQRLVIDSLEATLPAHRWSLQQPVTVAVSDSAPRLGRMRVVADSGGGRITASGLLPWLAPGALAVEASEVDLRDVASVLSRDSTLPDGRASFSLALGGTRASPVGSARATLVKVRSGEQPLPDLTVAMQYADRILTADGRALRGADTVGSMEARLPLDLAWDADVRQVEDSLVIRLRADSLDLALVQAVVPSVRGTRGSLGARAQVGGTWSAPRLSGQVEVRRGALLVPALGIVLDTVTASAELAGDSVQIRRLHLVDRGGRLDVTGAVRATDLTRPVLALDLDAERFRAIDVRGFLALTVTGKARLVGPWDAATISGSVRATSGAYYFADLVTKRVLAFDEAANADLVDTVGVGSATLADAFHSRFLDNLTADNLEVTLGNDVWLRSNEANVQLGGAVRVNKQPRRPSVPSSYRFDGTLDAQRGSYLLRIGPASREFTVEQGTVRFFGTPDLNGELDITARHLVNPPGGGTQIPIVATISGTVLQPRFSLSSVPGSGVPLSDADLSSYLLFGVASRDLGSSFSAGTAVSNVIGLLWSELERWAVTNRPLGVPFSRFRVQSGLGATLGNASATAITQTRLEAGVQVGERTFVTLNAGFCTQGNQFVSQGLFGAGIEYRISTAWRVSASYEPALQACFASLLGAPARYQLGADVRWEREF